MDQFLCASDHLLPFLAIYVEPGRQFSQKVQKCLFKKGVAVTYFVHQRAQVYCLTVWPGQQFLKKNPFKK